MRLSYGISFHVEGGSSPARAVYFDITYFLQLFCGKQNEREKRLVHFQRAQRHAAAERKKKRCVDAFIVTYCNALS